MGGGDRYATGATSPQKIHGREHITIATWHVRTLAQTGKLQELTHELDRYTWHVVGLCKTRWKSLGDLLTEEGHILYYTGEFDKHQKSVGFTVVQLQNIIDGVDKKDILIIQGDWNAKVGADALTDWRNYCGPSCNATTNERVLHLLEFASYNNMVLANTIGVHKASWGWTWHAPNGSDHQIDYIMVQNRFRSGIRRAKTGTFPGTDVGSDHDLVILNFRVRLKKIKKKTPEKFNLDRLMDPSILESFQATVGGKFAALLTLDEDAEAMTTKINAVMTEAANDILGKLNTGSRMRSSKCATQGLEENEEHDKWSNSIQINQQEDQGKRRMRPKRTGYRNSVQR